MNGQQTVKLSIPLLSNCIRTTVSVHTNHSQKCYLSRVNANQTAHHFKKMLSTIILYVRCSFFLTLFIVSKLNKNDHTFDGKHEKHFTMFLHWKRQRRWWWPYTKVECFEFVILVLNLIK